MKNCNSNFMLGLGIGSVIGALAYRFSRTTKAKRMRIKVCHHLHRMGHQAEELFDTAKDKIMDAGSQIAEKVADKRSNLEEKADEFKDKVNSFVAEVKK